MSEKPEIVDPVERARRHAFHILNGVGRVRADVPDLLAHQNMILCDIAVTNRETRDLVAELYHMAGAYIRR